MPPDITRQITPCPIGRLRRPMAMEGHAEMGMEKLASPSLRRGEIEDVAAVIEVHIVLLANLNKVEGVSVGIQSQG